MESTYKILATTTGRTRYNFLQGAINDLYDPLAPALHSTDTTEIFLAKSLEKSKLRAIKIIDKGFNTNNFRKELRIQSDFSEINLFGK